jgi:hypothetical protein
MGKAGLYAVFFCGGGDAGMGMCLSLFALEGRGRTLFYSSWLEAMSVGMEGGRMREGGREGDVK